MSDAFSFTKLVVKDLEATHAFYSTVFGLKQQARFQAAVNDEPIDEIIYAPTTKGGAGLVLFQYVNRSTIAQDEVILGFRVEDIEAAVERAVAAGGSIHAPVGSVPEMGIKYAFVKDVEGHLIEIIQPLSKG